MKKIILFLLFLVSTIPVMAANDLSFTCTSLGCTKSSDLPLFAETNIYPGYTVSAKTSVTNSRPSNCQLGFRFNNQTESDTLSSVLSISAVGDTTVWYSGLVSDLFDNQTHPLGNLFAGSTQIFNWTVAFDQNSGNEYQNTNNLFDIDFSFTCDDEPSSADGGSDNPGAPVCHDAVPDFSPANLTTTSGTNSVTLNWTEPGGNFTYYLIAFGITPTADTYGHPNIGGQGTHSYTVNSLSAGTTYYFKIRVGNGCAPGPFTPVISATPGGTVLINPGVPAGFQAGVLGTETTTTLAVNQDQVIGPTPTYFRFWPFLLLAVILLFPLFLFLRRIFSSQK